MGAGKGKQRAGPLQGLQQGFIAPPPPVDPWQAAAAPLTTRNNTMPNPPAAPRGTKAFLSVGEAMEEPGNPELRPPEHSRPSPGPNPQKAPRCCSTVCW